MTFEKRKETALQELKKSGIWNSFSIPPTLTIQWKLGVKAKPPHYNSFLKNVLSKGLWFAVVWGFIMWIGDDFDVSGTIFLGVFFGVAMAAFYKWDAHKHQLSNWVDLPSKDGDA